MSSSRSIDGSRVESFNFGDGDGVTEFGGVGRNRNSDLVWNTSAVVIKAELTDDEVEFIDSASSRKAFIVLAVTFSLTIVEVRSLDHCARSIQTDHWTRSALVITFVAEGHVTNIVDGI